MVRNSPSTAIHGGNGLLAVAVDEVGSQRRVFPEHVLKIFTDSFTFF